MLLHCLRGIPGQMRATNYYKLDFRMIRLFFILLLSFISVQCPAMMQYAPHNYLEDMKLKIDMYKKYSYRELGPALSHVGLPFPPKKIALLVFKKSKKLELWARNNGPWHHVKDYKIYAASGHAGPKLREGDRQVPEGIYHISALNPDSRFDLSMEINYPNTFDKKRAQESGRKNLGGEIFIHGKRSSIGCIAIGDDNIEQLFVLAYFVGQKNIKIIIAPNDLRYNNPIYNRHAPKWTPLLYAKLRRALKPFQTAMLY